MLHHKNGVAAVTQLFEGLNQTHVVSLMESDAGLIKYIEHIDQFGAYLRSQTDALLLTAGK